MAATDDVSEAPRRYGSRANGGCHGDPTEHVIWSDRRVSWLQAFDRNRNRRNNSSIVDNSST